MTYPHWSRRMAWHIPDDWDGMSWDCCLLFWPESPQWKAIVRGHIKALSRGRAWDETTGTVTEVQKVARLISLAFDPSPAARQVPEVAEIMSCLDQIAEDVAAIRALMEAQADYSAQIDTVIDAVSVLEPSVGTLITLTELANEAIGTQDILPGGD